MTTWIHKHVVAKKKHFCHMCSRRIDPGETYMRGTGLDGTAWSWKECAHCDAVLHIYQLQWDDTYNESDFDNWCQEGASSITELRHQAGYRMRWRTKYGTLLPVPTKEAV